MQLKRAHTLPAFHTERESGRGGGVEAERESTQLGRWSRRELRLVAGARARSLAAHITTTRGHWLLHLHSRHSASFALSLTHPLSLWQAGRQAANMRCGSSFFFFCFVPFWLDLAVPSISVMLAKIASSPSDCAADWAREAQGE